MSDQKYVGVFFDIFGYMHDRRQEGKVLHKLIDVIFIAVCATIANSSDWEDMELWANRNEDWLRKYIDLPYGIPSQWTYQRIFSALDPRQFATNFTEWMQSITIRGEGTVVAVDGKTMCGTDNKRKGRKALHIVSAWCSSNKLILGQVKTSEKSNEITAIPELLEMLSIKGCIVTLDAMGCQKAIVKKIVSENKADYVIGLKGNQELLRDDVETFFIDEEKEGFTNAQVQKFRTKEKGHGRIEERRYYYTTDINWLDCKKDWTGLNGIGMVFRKCEIDGKITEERSFYIASVKTVDEFARGCRQHWGIESTHWSLDVTFGDDACKVSDRIASANLATLKRLALNMVKKDQEKYPKKSLKKRRYIATLDVDYIGYIIGLNLQN